MKKLLFIFLMMSGLYSSAQDSLIIVNSSFTWKNGYYTKTFDPIESLTYRVAQDEFNLTAAGEVVFFRMVNVNYISVNSVVQGSITGDSLRTLLVASMGTSTVFDTSAIYTAINSKMTYSDTASLSTRIDARVAYTDTFSTANYNYRTGYTYFNDFIIPANATTGDGHGIISNFSGSGATTTTVAPPSTNRVGIVQYTTGTTSTGRSAVQSGISFRTGGGKIIYTTDVNVVQLSSGSERFQLLNGFMGSFTAATQSVGAFFLYDEGGVSTGSSASTKWQCVTANGGSRTYTNSSATVTAGQWDRLQIIINAAGTSIDFLINGTVVATHTTNLPGGAGREVGFGVIDLKSIGTTPALVQSDFIHFNQLFTTPR